MTAINTRFLPNPMRLQAESPATSKIVIRASTQVDGDGAKVSQSPLSSSITAYPQTTLDFQTGAVAGGGTINGSGSSITLPTASIGQFVRAGFTFIAGGDVQVLFSAPQASLGALDAIDPGGVFVSGGTPLGYVNLEATAATAYKTAGSATSVVENAVSGNARIFRFLGGSGGGGSSAFGGAGGDLVDLLFKAKISDALSDIPNGTTPVDVASGFTDAALHDLVNSLYRLNYDATKTVTGTGTSMTLSGAPSFTIKIGDVLVIGSEVRKITAVGSQTTPTVEAAFSIDPTAAACTVSQAVHTVDLNAFDNNSLGLSVASQISDDVADCLVSYADSETLADIVPDYASAARIAYSVSGDGADWSDLRVRVTGLASEEATVSVPTPGSQFKIRFFANKTSGSGAVNLLGFKAYWHSDVAELAGSYQQIAFSRPAAAINQNCSHAVASGKSRFQFDWSFGRGLSDGQASGSALQVLANGQEVPRYVAGVTDVSQAYFIEIDDRTIEMDQDYSGSTTQFMFRLPTPVVDARAEATAAIAGLQSAVGSGFQDFVEPPAMIDCPYTTIVNRAKIPNLALDLKARMGVERFRPLNIFTIQKEQGPGGLRVHGIVDDKDNLVRFVGDWQLKADMSYGPQFFTQTVNDYVEITFYGTGLNVSLLNGADARDLRASVDGGSEGSNIYPGTLGSNVLGGRSYSPNNVAPVVNGLTLGIHTVKLRLAAVYFAFMHYEVLNESSTIKVNPGSAYIDGKKVTLLAQSLQAYNSGFESGTLGTRGGRAVVYLKADGTIGKAVQPVDATTLLSTSADHTNEEVIKSHYFREFGSRTTANDDYTANGSGFARSYVLEDGTTGLVGTANNNVTTVSSIEMIAQGGTNGSYNTFTFVGTGLDILRADGANGGADTFAFSVDGGANQTFATTGSMVVRTTKIVSGLPYGTHTVKFIRTSAPVTYDVFVANFIVYGPKKPSIPSGAIELADYNIMADFVPNTVAGLETIATGVLRKYATREFVYVDGTGGTTSWQLPAVATDRVGFREVNTDRTGYVEYTFFGTGFEFRGGIQANRSGNIGVTVNGTALTTANFGTAVFSTYGTGSAYNAGTGSLDMSDAATTNGSGFRCSGLPLAKYTLRFTNNSAGSFLEIDALDIITPIHAPRYAKAGTQNSLPIGNYSLSDSRVLSPVQNLLPSEKSWAVAVSIVSSPTTTSAPYLPLPDMSITMYVKGGLVEIDFRGSFVYTAGSNTAEFVFYIDGKEFRSSGRSFKVNANSTGYLHMTNKALVYLSEGVHHFQVMWSTNGGTLQAAQDLRMMTAREV
jgi:hypothetical protein